MGTPHRGRDPQTRSRHRRLNDHHDDRAKSRHTNQPKCGTCGKELAALDFVASGTLHHRTKVCGKPTCRCANDPAARHGPYHEWGRMRDGKLVQSTITPTQAKLLQRAITNHQRAKALLAEWERLTEAEILKPEAVTDD